jgi:thioredoxin 1
MAPALGRVANDFAERVPLWRSVKALKVMGIPTLIVFRDGVEVNRRSGQVSYPELTALFDWALADAGVAPPPGMSSQTRMLRLVSAVAIMILAVAVGQPWLLMVAAAIFFSAVHDRCPLWQAVQRRLSPPAKNPPQPA